METGFKASQTMCGCKDASAMTAVYGEWLANGMSRIAADVNDAREVALRLAQIGHKSCRDPNVRGVTLAWLSGSFIAELEPTVRAYIAKTHVEAIRLFLPLAEAE